VNVYEVYDGQFNMFEIFIDGLLK